jgi:hypothetical protein
MKKYTELTDVSIAMQMWITHCGIQIKQCFFGYVRKVTDRNINLSEKGEAKRDGAKLQKNSGRGKIQKGDARMGNFVVDYKEYSKSISISQEIWAKICTDTFKVDRSAYPLLKLILGEDSKKTRLAVIEWALFEEMLECWENKNNERK